MLHQRKTFWPALGLLLAWLILTGSLTWIRSRESVVAPVWDQLSYVMKADAFWDTISTGKITNPLNIEPSSRPPGTILITAPVGPLKDYRNFYFRSAFLPVVLMAVAAFVAGVGVTGLGWESAFVALLASSMPMFWQFEVGQIHNTGYSWGLVDTFQASLGALAMASLLVAALSQKRLWLAPALIALALVPLVKPSGFVLAGLMSLAWLVLAIRFRRHDSRGVRRQLIGLLGSSAAIVGVLAALMFASLHSAYFSTRNMEFGRVALAQLRSEWMQSDTLQNLFMIFTGAIGLPILFSVSLLAGTAALQRHDKATESDWIKKAQWSAAIGLVLFLIGLGLTYQATLFRQTRYFFPVLAIATVLFVPILASWMNKCGPRLCGIMAIMPSALTIFLAFPGLANAAYIFGGYGLFTGFGNQEAKTTRHLIDLFRVSKPALPVLFTTTDGVSSAAVEAAFLQRLRELGVPDAAALGSIYRPFSWENGGVVKISSIYNSDVIAIDGFSRVALGPKPLKRHIQAPSLPSTLSFGEEIGAWKSWLATTSESGMTQVALETPNMILLVVKDRSALEREMRKYIASRPWRPEFLLENGRKEFAAGDLLSLPEQGSQIVQPVTFGGVVRVHSLALSRVPNQPKLHVSIYTELLSAGQGRSFSLFIHQLDANGVIIANHDLALGQSRFPERPVSLRSEAFQLLPATRKVAVGIYEPSGSGSLVSDWKLANDWQGRRAMFSLGSLPKQRNQ